MSGILDMITQHLSPSMVTQIGNQIGVDPAQAQQAINAALPSVFGGMAEHANHDAGAAQINDALQTSAVPDDMAGGPATDSGILGKILGHRTDAVQQSVANSAGINTQQAGKILMYIAPIALSVLAHQHSQLPQSEQGQGALSNILRSAQQTASGMSGGGGLGGILGHIFS